MRNNSRHLLYSIIVDEGTHTIDDLALTLHYFVHAHPNDRTDGVPHYTPHRSRDGSALQFGWISLSHLAAKGSRRGRASNRCVGGNPDIFQVQGQRIAFPAFGDHCQNFLPNQTAQDCAQNMDRQGNSRKQ